MERLVQRPRTFEITIDGGAVQRDARLRQGVRVARDPPLGAGQGELQEHVVRADQQVQLRRQLGDLVGTPYVAAELLDRHDVTGRVQARQQWGSQVHLRVVRVVVRDDREPGLGDLGVMRLDDAIVGAVAVRREKQYRAGTGLQRLLRPAP
jgi:hypothetical protein